MNNYDACDLYRLDLKQVDSNKNTKEKVMGDYVNTEKVTTN